MLVLGRKIGEGITVETKRGDKLQIYVTDIKRNQVRLGFEGSQNFLILRDELLLSDKA